MNCDNCSHYCWYYDHCDKWDCEVDGREVHDCFEPYSNRASRTGTCMEVEQVMNKLIAVRGSQQAIDTTALNCPFDSDSRKFAK